ncbi:uncharacterized protein J3D65DRAFT_629769 [Phyllosticta citribraziliensis]|uniref:Uncharacterized protein n=1 Tax=Phyllosticta citribraziliensis TaxID=989973 RepID=A0ABR1LKF4_9PEZI
MAQPFSDTMDIQGLLSALGVTSEEPTTFTMLSQMAQDLMSNSGSTGSAGSVVTELDEDFDVEDYWEDFGGEEGYNNGEGFERTSGDQRVSLAPTIKPTAVDIIASLRGHMGPGKDLYEPWRRSELEPMLCGTIIDGRPIDSQYVREYRDLIEAIVRHNCTGTASHDIAAWQTLTTPTPLDVPWLKRRTRERWAQRYETETGRALLALKQRLKTSTGLDRLLYGPNLKYFRRLAYRKMGDECRRDVLDEFAQTQLAAPRAKCEGELALLQLLYHGQRAELKTRIQAPLSLVDVVEEMHAELAVVAGSGLCFVEPEVEVLETLVDMAEEVVDKVERSTAALLARDVQGKTARREESQRRFGMPDSFGSMMVSLDDLDLVRSTARSVVGMAEQMGEELEQVALAAVDAVGATKDLMLMKELRGLSEAG